MIFLILAVSVNIVFTLLYKISERKNCHPVAIITSFFSVALITSTVYIYFTSKLVFDWRIFLIGAVGGLATYGAIHAFLVLLKLGKFGLSTVLVNLSLSIPVLVSILLYGERPSLTTYIAFGLTVITFFLIGENNSRGDRIKKFWLWFILVLTSMVLSGVADTGPKIIQELGLGDLAMNYLVFNYLFALIPTIFLGIRRKQFPKRKEWLIGSGLGLTGLFNMFFLTMALRAIPGTLAYPINITVVSIAIILLSYIIWKEKLNPRQIAGVITAITATVLISINI
jgi:drug/metabolite transporter (DMT)-like permease